MGLTLYLLDTYTAYPPLFVTANNAFDAVDLYREYYRIGAYPDDARETVVEVYRVPPIAPQPQAHMPDHSTVTGACDLGQYAVTFETAYRIPTIIRLDDEVPF